jgi:hypothetical protein
MKRLFRDQRNIHVLYSYDEKNKYIERVVSFIKDGVEAEETIFLIENEPSYMMIQKELIKHLTDDQLKFVYRINNFDFYFSSGSYHPPAIVDYFQKTVRPYVENKASFRCWAHVEWATMKGPLHIIEELEKAVDEAVNELSFPLICAYEADRMPAYLNKLLMETHPYVLIEDELIVSENYQSLKKEEIK